MRVLYEMEPAPALIDCRCESLRNLLSCPCLFKASVSALGSLSTEILIDPPFSAVEQSPETRVVGLLREQRVANGPYQEAVDGFFGQADFLCKRDNPHPCVTMS